MWNKNERVTTHPLLCQRLFNPLIKNAGYIAFVRKIPVLTYKDFVQKLIGRKSKGFAWKSLVEHRLVSF